MTDRCAWTTSDPLYIDYHDREWGVPVFDDRTLFAFLILEGAQAGLSWYTILKKRAHYYRAYADFDPQAVAAYDAARIEALMQDAGIVRNRLKILASVDNAKAFLELQAKHGAFAQYIWSFVNGRPIVNHFRSAAEVPAATPLSDAVSKDLKRLGFRFVGTTICYSFMQATGMVMDHTTDCFRHAELAARDNHFFKK